jgi:3-deoxy-D-manno-octulosonic-acid transferase
MIAFGIYLVFITLLEILLYLPLKLIFSKQKSLSRLGYYPSKSSKTIWFHAASLGEVNALKPLLQKVISEYGAQNIVLTTMTSTGQNAGRQIDKELSAGYIPLDFPFAIARFYQSIKPALIVIMETEFWPQMLYQAFIRKIPVIVINGRLSEKSWDNYHKTRYFWKIPFDAIKEINAQSPYDKSRFEQLGFPLVHSKGNLKFSLNLTLHNPAQKRKDYGINSGDFVLTFGSSRPGEEAMLAGIYQQLAANIPHLRLIIAPRHLKRLTEINEVLSGLDFVLYSELKIKPHAKVIIIDEIGLLTEIYSFSDLVIVGGSFKNFGGHNPLEPAFYAKPVIMGQYYSSCLDTVNKLRNGEGITITKEENLANIILKFYNDSHLRRMQGENAKNILEKNSLALQDNLNTIKTYLNSQ